MINTMNDRWYDEIPSHPHMASYMADLVLETSFEELRNHFSDSQANSKLMEFVEPLAELEGAINEIATSLNNSGKLVFLLGHPGTGKSTFIESLGWRPNLSIRELKHLNANELTSDADLGGLFSALEKIGAEAKEKKDKGPTLVSIDYLENLAEFEATSIKGFFRKANGLLRNVPILIIWPVTQKTDVDEMRAYAADVSGTLFYRSKEVIPFYGPPEDRFIDITKRTISVLNDGAELSDFSLASKHLEEALEKLQGLPAIQHTFREYLELVKEEWRLASRYQERVRSQIPKSTEVWFIFSYPDAESVVSQFIRRTTRIEDSWVPISDKFSDYIHNNTQRSAIWDAQRLQLALYGAIKTRVMFLPTNSLISCVGAYSKDTRLQTLLTSLSIPAPWKEKEKAKRALSRTSLFKQLMGEILPAGKRKGGPAAKALDDAAPIFAQIVTWMTTGGSDKEINKCIGDALAESSGLIIETDKSHPWIPNIIPDLFIDLGHKQVCVEFHHTNKNEPGIVADYVLKKLNVYINQLDQLIKSKSA